MGSQDAVTLPPLIANRCPRSVSTTYVVEVLQCPAVRVDQVISPVSEVCDLGGARDLGGRDAGSA